MDVAKVRSVASDYIRYVSNRDERAAQSVSQFYDMGKEKPSTARCILVDEAKKRAEYIKVMYNEDLKFMGVNEAVKLIKEQAKNLIYYGFEIDAKEEVLPYLQEFSRSFREAYPLTGDLRCRLIDTGRVRMDKIMPKLSKFVKFLEWRNSVPKEFSQMLKKVVK